MTSPAQRPGPDRLLVLPLSFGRLRARCLGSDGAPPTLLVHGPSAKLRVFEDDPDHYSVMTSETAGAAVEQFLRGE